MCVIIRTCIVLFLFYFLKAHGLLTAELTKHDYVLQPGEQFEINFPTDVDELISSCDELRQKYFIASREFLLCLTLQKPDSKKYQDRLLDTTSQISSYCKVPWESVVFPRLVAEIKAQMGTTATTAPAAPEEPPAKKQKKDKETDKKEKKKDKKEKKAKKETKA